MNKTKKNKNSIKLKKRNKTNKKPKINISLYLNNHPNTSIKGYGYANKKKAIETIKLLKKLKKGRTYDLQVLNTMYNRAKYHKYRNKNMEEAMKVFEKELKKIKVRK